MEIWQMGFKCPECGEWAEHVTSLYDDREYFQCLNNSCETKRFPVGSVNKERQAAARAWFDQMRAPHRAREE